MIKRLTGFYCYKFSSDRLAKSKYKINTNIQEARKNSELVKLGDSTLLEVIRRTSNHPYDSQKLDFLNRIFNQVHVYFLCLLRLKKKYTFKTDQISFYHFRRDCQLNLGQSNSRGILKSVACSLELFLQ